MALVLRGYQKDTVDEVRSKMRQGYKRILVSGPTGMGKTALATEMLKNSSEKDLRSWFIVHRRELVKQSALAFHKSEVYHGIIANKFPKDPRAKVQICSIQSLARRLDKIDAPKLIIWDEAHHISASTWDNIFQMYPDIYHIGLTATPWRLDGKGFEDYFDVMVEGPTVEWLINNEYLSPYRLFKPSEISLKGVKTQMGDYKQADLLDIIDKPTITGSAINEYKKFGDDKRAVVFAISVEHSKNIVADFNGAGIEARHVDGETPQYERDEAIELFKEGKVRVLSNVNLFTEGFDLPAIEILIMLRPTQSLGLYLQMIGRVLRIFPGKKEAVILDHVGNVDRHGLPDDDREWSLEGRPRRKKKENGSESVKICDNCFAAQGPATRICFNCGHPFAATENEIVEAEGELVEIKKAEFRAKKKKEQSKAQSLEELQELGRQRGYKPGWAFNIWKVRGGKR